MALNHKEFQNILTILTGTGSVKEKNKIFTKQSFSVKVSLFQVLPQYIQYELIDNISEKEALSLLAYFDPYTSYKLVVHIKNKNKRQYYMKKLQEDMSKNTQDFLGASGEYVSSVLRFNYILVSFEAKIKDVAQMIDEYYQEVGDVPEIFVQREGVFVGEVSFYSIIQERNNKKLKHVIAPVDTVHFQDSFEKLKKIFLRHKKKKIVILDSHESIVGVVYADDILRHVAKNTAHALYDFAGVEPTENVNDSVLSKVKSRYQWLIVNLATAFLAAWVVSLFENTIQSLVLLAIYLPIVAGMGGNAATQTLAVMVRGISRGQVDIKRIKKPLMREIKAGAINGFINGILVAIVAFWFNSSAMLGVVVGISMIINLMIAAFFGTIIPVLMKSFGKDPATSATIFITTATDVFGFFVFLGLATLFLV